MTTSYELSLRLKEAGAVQTNREHYWVKSHGGEIYRYAGNQLRHAGADGSILCAAFTLGELARGLGKHIEFEILFFNHKHGKEVFARRKNYFTGRCSRTEKEHSPEEAAGELYYETLKSKL